jgi:EAL domain-containing protein (putative c-di-GMP-specific phosphodiesterase class I)
MLDLTVVAEGVETQTQLNQGIDLGADRAQGFFISHPLLPE